MNLKCKLPSTPFDYTKHLPKLLFTAIATNKWEEKTDGQGSMTFTKHKYTTFDFFVYC